MQHPVKADSEGMFLVVAVLLVVLVVTNAVIVGLAVWYVRSRIGARDRWRLFFLRGIPVTAGCLFLGIPVLSQMRGTPSVIVGLGVALAPGIGAITAVLALRHRQLDKARWQKRYSDT